jgi:tetratricopeptide (TPR) repeat protein
MLVRDFAAAERVAVAYPAETLPSVAGAPLPKSYLQGCAVLAAGEPDRARPFLEAARLAMEAETQRSPASAIRHARLGLLYAYLGRGEDAIRSARRATELQPESSDAYGGATYSSFLALVYARTGEADRALELIRRLLATPGPVFFQESGMTLSDLRLRWQWDPLRGDPRFQKILEEAEPSTRR